MDSTHGFSKYDLSAEVLVVVLVRAYASNMVYGLEPTILTSSCCPSTISFADFVLLSPLLRSKVSIKGHNFWKDS